MINTAEKKALPSSEMPPAEVGSFAVYGDAIKWYKCREQFAPVWQPQTAGIVFSFKEGEKVLESVAAFIQKVERVILELGEESTFYVTNRKYAVYVCPAEFWKSCFIRRSLFTALLRAGQQYKPDLDNFDEALYSIKYLKDTKDAVLRFLFGFTEFNRAECVRITGNEPQGATGWHAIFANRSAIHVRAMLNSSKEKDDNAIGKVSLWT